MKSFHSSEGQLLTHVDNSDPDRLYRWVSEVLLAARFA